MTERVVAVIVTYRRPELLARCVAAVFSQTRRPDHVLVVDNDGSNTAALAERFAGEPLEVLDAGENLGPAGGYARGIARALSSGASAVWTVDDDCLPQAGCLDTLLSVRLSDALPGVRIPVQQGDDGEIGSPPSWNGTLFDAEVLHAVGGPRPDWFFWKEDIDLINRAGDAGFSVRSVPEAVVEHRPQRRAPGTPRDWRLYYETRNALTYRTRTRRRTWMDVPIAWRNAVATAWTIARHEPNKGRSLWLWSRGVADHLLHRMGRRVDPETWSDRSHI